MTTGEQHTACSHCLLPLGLRPMQRMVNGEERAFCCYGCCISFQVKNGKSEEWEAAWLLIRLGVGAFLSMNIMLISLLLYAGAFEGVDAWLLPWIHILLWIFATPALVILGGPFLRDSWVNAMHGRLTASALIVLGVGAAYFYSAMAVIGRGEQAVYFDTATMVLMLFTLGSYLEAAARARAARDLEPLLAAEREQATIVEAGMETRRSVGLVEAGMLVRIRPGERIPVDGVVVEGQSHNDEAVITGRAGTSPRASARLSLPAVLISMDRCLFRPVVQVPRPDGQRSAGRCGRRCRAAARLANCRYRRWSLVPLVLVLGALTVLYWVQSLPFDRALLIGLSVLVVACPCAVGLAAPLATSLGIGRLARCGCLVRDPGALEALACTRLLAFDKTGTLTSGRPQIVAIESEQVGSDEVLARAAGLERHSEHGLARAITMAAAARGLEPVIAYDIVVMPGRGIRGRSDGQVIAAGNRALMSELSWSITPALAERAQSFETNGHTVVYVGWEGGVHAIMALDDTPLAEMRRTIEALRRQGFAIRVLTGDLTKAARRVAMAVGIGDDEIESGLSPEAKRMALARHRRSHGVGGDGWRRPQ